MRRIILTAVVLIVGLSGVALAADNPLYVGVKAGKMMVDLEEYDDATNAGVVLGYTLSAGLAIEGEYTTTISDGDLTVLGINGEWDIDTLAVYMVYRSAGDFYLKAKAGILREDVNISIVGVEISGTDTGLSLGIGGGWKIGDAAALEIEYSIVEEDVDFLSLGINYKF